MEALKIAESQFKVYSMQEVAQFLNVNDQTIFRLIDDGSLRGVKVKNHRVLHDDLVAYLAGADRSSDTQVSGDTNRQP